MILDNIEFIKGYSLVKDLGVGYSKTPKFVILLDGKQLFVKISPFEIPQNLPDLLRNVPHAPILDIGKVEDKFYIVEEYLDAPTLKDVVCDLDENIMFDFGYKMGTSYSSLRNKFPDRLISCEELNYLKKKVYISVEDLQSLFSDDTPKQVVDFSLEVIDYLLKNIDVFKNATMVFGNTDIKPNNFVYIDNNVFAVDYDYTDYVFVPYALNFCLSAYRFENTKKYQSFASGYIAGLFGKTVPDKFDNHMDYMFVLVCARYMIKYLERKDYKRAISFVKFVKDKYIVDGKLEVFSNLEIIKNTYKK